MSGIGLLLCGWSTRLKPKWESLMRSQREQTWGRFAMCWLPCDATATGHCWDGTLCIPCDATGKLLQAWTRGWRRMMAARSRNPWQKQKKKKQTMLCWVSVRGGRGRGPGKHPRTDNRATTRRSPSCRRLEWKSRAGCLRRSRRSTLRHLQSRKMSGTGSSRGWVREMGRGGGIAKGRMGRL